MKVVVVGGTGFLGYHAVNNLVAGGHDVVAVGLPPGPREPLFSDDVEVLLTDVGSLGPDEAVSLFRGCDGLVFAAGADDRVILRDRSAEDFFQEVNVATTERVLRAAKQAGASRAVVLGSYFAHFARVWPELNLAETHPYIRSRLDQTERAFALRDGEFAVTTLELPWIWGTSPGATPLWCPLVRYVAGTLPVILFPDGGTNMVAVSHVAEAITGALERGVSGTSYQVGDENLSWREFLDRLSTAMQRPKPVWTLPAAVVKVGGYGLSAMHSVQHVEGGLDPVGFVDLFTRETYFDPQPARDALGFGSGGLDEAFAATAAAC